MTVNGINLKELANQRHELYAEVNRLNRIQPTTDAEADKKLADFIALRPKLSDNLKAIRRGVNALKRGGFRAVLKDERFSGEVQIQGRVVASWGG